jgi:ribosomal protein S18 acetylase RimI-like enzyme
MSTGWSWIEPIRQRHFGPPLAGTYPIERLERTSYWDLHEAVLRPHFPPECFIHLQGLLDEHELRGRERLAATQGGDPLQDFWVARDGQGVVAMFCGQQKDADTYRMWHSHVHPDYRRRGVYTEIVQRTLDYSREAGFSAVVSEHAPSNNAIIIAKLKAGFRIVGMDIDAGVGPGLLLKYFHNPAHLRAYEFRCGLASLDEQLIAAGAGAMPLLIEQIRRTTG